MRRVPLTTKQEDYLFSYLDSIRDPFRWLIDDRLTVFLIHEHVMHYFLAKTLGIKYCRQTGGPSKVKNELYKLYGLYLCLQVFSAYSAQEKRYDIYCFGLHTRQSDWNNRRVRQRSTKQAEAQADIKSQMPEDKQKKKTKQNLEGKTEVKLLHTKRPSTITPCFKPCLYSTGRDDSITTATRTTRPRKATGFMRRTIRTRGKMKHDKKSRNKILKMDCKISKTLNILYCANCPFFLLLFMSDPEGTYARSEKKLINLGLDGKENRLAKMNGYFTEAGFANQNNTNNNASAGTLGSKLSPVNIDNSSNALRDGRTRNESSTESMREFMNESMSDKSDGAETNVGMANTETNVAMANTETNVGMANTCLLYTSPSPRDRQKSRMPSSA